MQRSAAAPRTIEERKYEPCSGVRSRRRTDRELGSHAGLKCGPGRTARNRDANLRKAFGEHQRTGIDQVLTADRRRDMRQCFDTDTYRGQELMLGRRLRPKRKAGEPADDEIISRRCQARSETEEFPHEQQCMICIVCTRRKGEVGQCRRHPNPKSRDRPADLQCGGEEFAATLRRKVKKHIPRQRHRVEGAVIPRAHAKAHG